MNRPVIGIPSPIERATWGPWEGLAHVLGRAYVDAVQRAGGAALILPADPVWVTDPDPILDLLDGLLLAGRADVDPQFYRAQPHPETPGAPPPGRGPPRRGAGRHRPRDARRPAGGHRAPGPPFHARRAVASGG